LGHYVLNYDRGRGHVTDKVYNFAGVHHGYIEVAISAAAAYRAASISICLNKSASRPSQ
jgi:hypothetical protein